MNPTTVVTMLKGDWDEVGAADLDALLWALDDLDAIPGLRDRVESGPTKFVCRAADDQTTDAFTLTATDLDSALEEGEEATREWIESGEWGDEGARIEAWYEIRAGGHVVSDRTPITVDIPPDEKTLIQRAGGDTTCAHEWATNQIWSTGGTTLIHESRCRKCGLVRTETRRGSQRNPGEPDLIEFSIPEEDSE